MGQFTIFLINTEPQKLNTTADILTEQNKLTACIGNQWNTAEFSELQQREIQQEQVILEEYEEKMKKNENVIVKADTEHDLIWADSCVENRVHGSTYVLISDLDVIEENWKVIDC